MPTVRYPYMIVAGRPSPLIPLGLGYQGTWKRVQAYVDSGAFYSIFKPALPHILGIDLQQGARVQVQGGDGGRLLVYLHQVTLQLFLHQVVEQAMNRRMLLVRQAWQLAHCHIFQRLRHGFHPGNDHRHGGGIEHKTQRCLGQGALGRR